MTTVTGLVTEGLVSTIIPVLHRAKMLNEAVESVLAQTYRPIEVIISDDGSTDETRQVGEAYARRHPEVVRYFWNENRGPGPAREFGRVRARGEFIQYLDSDDLLMARKFAIQVDALRREVSAGVAYGVTRLVSLDGNILVERFKWTGREILTLFPLLLTDRWWCTHTPLYRASVLEQVGPWSDLRYSQDWEYDARVGALVTRLVSCNEAVSDHRVHGEVRQTGSGVWLATRERVRFFTSLHGCAIAAGVRGTDPEMRHFSRWVFRHARECAGQGDSDSARRLYQLAVRAIGSMSFDVAMFRLAAAALGWQTAARLSEWLRARGRRRAGTATMPQSWMGSS